MKDITIVNQEQKTAKLVAGPSYIEGNPLTVVGSLGEGSQILPQSTDDAVTMIKWLDEFISHNKTDEEKAAIGQQWAEMLGLKRTYEETVRYVLPNGEKRPLGVYHSVLHLIRESLS